MSSALNLKAVKVFGPEINKVLNANIEISAEMLEAATTLKSDGMEFSDALEVLQQLFPKKTGASEGTMYLHGDNNVVVLGNISGGTINFASSSSSSRGRSRSTTSTSNSKANNGDWKFEGEKVFLNSPWGKAANCKISAIEDTVVINTNGNGKKVKVGYYSETQKVINGFTEFLNTKSKPTLKHGKGPEGYYYVKTSVLAALPFLEMAKKTTEPKAADETFSGAF